MAREPDRDSGGSQFFICLAPVPRLDHQYTTFGKLIKGDDVLGKIGDTPVSRNSMGEMSKPTKRVTIEKIDIVAAGSVKERELHKTIHGSRSSTCAAARNTTRISP